MNQDKPPKHKPQQKHTLSEVLKSLQDLIRTDLVPGEATAKPAAARPPQSKPAPPPPPPTEPDSFNEALDTLEDMIKHKIVEPVERARETPLEPMLPDETIEIEWDEPAVLAPIKAEQTPEAIELQAISDDFPAEENITLDTLPPERQQTEPPLALENAIELEALEAKSVDDNSAAKMELMESEPPGSDKAVPLEAPVVGSTDAPDLGAHHKIDAASEETIELDLAPPPADPASLTSDKAQETFDFPLVAELSHSLAKTAEEAEPESSKADHEASIEITLDAETIELLPEADQYDTTSTIDTEADSTRQQDDAAKSPASSFVVEFTPTKREPAKNAAKVAPPDDAKKPPVDKTPAAPDSTPLASTTLAGDPPAPTREPVATHSKKDTAERPAKPPAKSSKATGSKADIDDPNAPVQTEIPVLSEIADVTPPPAADLPDPTHARDIAIRVIAKLNIERRKAGERPLDIKTIEKLQQYLADALHKRSLNKPK